MAEEVSQNEKSLKHARLKEFVKYDPETGHFSWLKDSPMTVKGARAGYKHIMGYWELMVQHQRYLAHRLAWFFVHEEWPPAVIDHINGIRSDNRIKNLRLANQSQNIANSKKSSANACGFKGVRMDHRRGHWVANIKKNYKRIYLGSFSTPEEAHEAYKKAAVDLHKEFARWE